MMPIFTPCPQLQTWWQTGFLTAPKNHQYPHREHAKLHTLSTYRVLLMMSSCYPSSEYSHSAVLGEESNKLLLPVYRLLIIWGKKHPESIIALFFSAHFFKHPYTTLLMFSGDQDWSVANCKQIAGKQLNGGGKKNVPAHEDTPFWNALHIYLHPSPSFFLFRFLSLPPPLPFLFSFPLLKNIKAFLVCIISN